MTDIAPLPLNDLLTAMGKGSSTQGWDIVCSYSIDALNAILAASHARGTIVTRVKFLVNATDPLTGDPFTIDYDLQLDAPTLQFQSGLSGWCTLTMPLQGTYVITPEGGTPRPGAIPPGYSLIANVPLAAMRGDGQVSQVGDVVTFEEGDPTQAHIVVHFKTSAGSKSSYGIQPTPPPEDHSILVTFLLPYIQEHFQEKVDEIDYALTGLTNIAQGSAAAGETVITPKSFVFASDTGILSLYIQTANSGNPQGSIHPSFQPGGVETLPIPQGYTCSLIFSRQFVENVYLAPALAKLGRYAFDDTVKPGIGVNLYLDRPALSYNPSHLGQDQLSCDTIVIDYSQLPFKLLLLDNEVTLNWTYSQNVHWATDFIDLQTGDDLHQEGNTLITVSLPTNPPVSSRLVGSGGSDIHISLSVQPGQFAISTSGPTGWLSDGPEIARTITSFVQGNLPPPINLDFGSLNYFLAANLLFPGQQVFFADDSVGLNVSGDMLLVGTLGQKKATAAAKAR